MTDSLQNFQGVFIFQNQCFAERPVTFDGPNRSPTNNVDGQNKASALTDRGGKKIGVFSIIKE
jgi:hypothetical protein